MASRSVPVLGATAILLLLACLAWWPLLLSRPVVADDHLNGELVRGGMGLYWEKYGIWRSAGHPPPFWLREAIPGGDRLGALATHLAVVTLLFALTRRVTGSLPTAVAASAFFAVTPFGFQALTWNSALSFALSTAFALAAYLSGTRPIHSQGEALRAGLLAALFGFLSLSANEATLLLIAWLAGYQIVRGWQEGQLRHRLTTAALILAVEGVWVILHLATKTADLPKGLAFRTPALISGLFYQHRQSTYFTHLPQLLPWLTPAAFLSGILAFALLAWSAWRMPAWREAAPPRSLPWLEALAFAGLPIAAVAIYALGGGFSTDARKAYVLWPFLLLAGARFLAITPVKMQRAALWATILLSPVLVLCSQATTNAWAQTGTVFEKAEAFLVNRPELPGPFAFIWDGNIYEAWPDFDAMCGFRFDTPWVVGSGVGDRALLPGPPRTTLWRPEGYKWEARPE